MVNNIQNIFKNLRNEFLIIGLTGAVGSGCTTSANFLSKEHESFDIDGVLNCHPKDEFDIEYRKLLRVQQFYQTSKWKSFYHIRVSDLLLLVLISHIDDVQNMPKIDQFVPDKEVKDDLSKIFHATDILIELKDLAKKFIIAISKYDDTNESIEIILRDTAQCIAKGVSKDNEMYTSLFQALGENIRKSGSIYCDDKNRNSIYKQLNFSDYKELPIFIIPELIRRTIKLLRKKLDKPHFFVIDALRNTYEIEFFRNRYQSFYLFSILASEHQRKQRILTDFKLNSEDFKVIKTFETNAEGVESQAINACIGKADIFVNNDSKSTSKSLLYLQLVKYIALIRKPGLFTPTDDERFMQVAFTARYSSGCISRQVGAAVTGSDGYLRGFGWNDVPEKHISCLYRTPQQLLGCSNNFIFSAYERSKSFYTHIQDSISEQNKTLPFCFKDQQNSIELNKKVEDIVKSLNGSMTTEAVNDILKRSKMKNPTRERALHAEENAFLQIAKSGGQSVVGGTLYSTDSPCQLCSKKAMQLKIKRIVYIDAYPDISEQHTLKAGIQNEWPDFDMFSGAIGSAYFKLYVPIVGIKDEIKMSL